MKKTSEPDHDRTPRPRRRGITGLASAAVLLGAVATTLAAGEQPAAANCDIPADIKISDASVVEGTTAGFLQFTTLKFTVNSNANATSVDWKTQNGPAPTVVGWSAATEPADYTKSEGTVQLDGNPKTIYVIVKRDAVKETHDRMSVWLSNAKGCYANIADRVGYGHIYNDD